MLKERPAKSDRLLASTIIDKRPLSEVGSRLKGCKSSTKRDESGSHGGPLLQTELEEKLHGVDSRLHQ